MDKVQKHNSFCTICWRDHVLRTADNCSARLQGIPSGEDVVQLEDPRERWWESEWVKMGLALWLLIMIITNTITIIINIKYTLTCNRELFYKNSTLILCN
jgi:hypothetical protein